MFNFGPLANFAELSRGSVWNLKMGKKMLQNNMMMHKLYCCINLGWDGQNTLQTDSLFQGQY